MAKVLVADPEKLMKKDAPKTSSDDIAALVAQLRAVVGDRHCLTEQSDKNPYLRDWRNMFRSASPVVVRPGSTEEVSRVVAACAAKSVPVVPQGGNTGLVGGSVASADARPAVLINLSRLNQVRAIDPIDMSMTVEAGCTLSAAKKAAANAGCLLPLTLASEGSCEIGGILSTNAGGNNVFRYGSSRDRALGLEVVLPDSRIWNGLRRLRKDNAGYCLRELFLGAEGTLGIITAAIISLEPEPVSRSTAFVSAISLDAAVSFAALMRKCMGSALIACELLPKRGIEFVLRHVPQTRKPCQELADWNVLLECADGRDGEMLVAQIESALSEAMALGLISDAILPSSLEQAQKLWQLREELPEVQRLEGGSIKHDVAVPVSRVAEFISAAMMAVERDLPGIRPVPFGHLCDGNIHFNLSQPLGVSESKFMALWPHFDRIVHDIVGQLDGTFAAEHGIGLLKRDDMRRYKSEIELDLMRRLKQSIDPLDLMNPGKIIPSD